MSQARVYIDGFNLFHGAVRPTRTHWLNLARLCEELLPGLVIARIKYFTAMVSDQPQDRSKSIRQQAYHRALKTLPNVEIILGQFSSRKANRSLAVCKESPACYIQIVEQKEKGSDVNLATHLIHDGHRGFFDTALIISGDSDLVEPIRIVRQDLRKSVIVVNPRPFLVRELERVASRYQTMAHELLRRCQFPDRVIHGAAVIHKSAEWAVAASARSQRPVHSVKCPECPQFITTKTLR